MWRQSFGLLEKSYSHDTTGSFLLGKWLHVPLSTVPLCSAVVDVAIQDYVADVASELIYQNKSQVSREVLFVFPLGPHMAIYSFQACSEDAKVQAMLRDEAQQLHEATGGWENLKYLQDQSNCPGEVFACFLGTLPPGREVVVTLRYVQELPREPDGAAHFVLPPTLHPHTKHYAWNCLTSKLPYSLLLTASLQSPRGVANVQANFALTPLIYTARDRSTAQVSLAGRPPGGHDLELLVYFGEPTAVSAVVEKGAPGAPPGSLLGDPMVLVMLAPSIPEAVPGQRLSGEFIFLLDTTFLKHAQLFIFMAGPPPDKEAIAAEVCRHRNSHRCFSFCFSEDSAALATALASETGGEAAYVSSDNSMILVVSKCLKRALKLAAEEVSLSWTLPCGLEVEVLGGTPQSIFQGQHSLLYAQIHGQAQDTTVAKGVMTLKYSLDGQDVSHSIEFPLCPQGDGRLAGHRLAARCLLKRLLPEAASGSGDEPRHRAVEISLASGIICPFTSYVGVRTSQRVTWYRGPLALLPPRQSLIPCQTIELRGSIMSSSCHRRAIWVPPGWLTAVSASWLALRRLTHGIAHLSQQGACSKACKPPPPPLSSLKHVNPEEFVLRFLSFGPWSTKDIAECQELVALQNVDGSWALGSGLASVLEVDEAEIKGKMPGEVLEPSIWATVLAVTWLNRNDKCYRDICELLEAKAVTWLCSRAVPLSLTDCSVPAGQVPGGSQHPPWDHRGAKRLQALSSTHALCYRPAAPAELKRARKYSLNSPTVLGYHCCYQLGSYIRDEFSLLMSYTSWAEPVSC
ncbi:von Willebrand factor A domain-containing protein 5A-like isoform X3 [Harpia harpyja]|uniref:von Willebrand factor A domain-containing protein 5A-like isoform X3 n=1 Tax=Harpia harpyja TaxID=202280 RepID=UPI0022B213AB|nr:von Willebrand factor A domain-containing protein 5A-like isoform X3 [Harpia harpyja]